MRARSCQRAGKLLLSVPGGEWGEMAEEGRQAAGGRLELY